MCVNSPLFFTDAEGNVVEVQDLIALAEWTDATKQGE